MSTKTIRVCTTCGKEVPSAVAKVEAKCADHPLAMWVLKVRSDTA